MTEAWLLMSTQPEVWGSTQICFTIWESFFHIIQACTLKWQYQVECTGPYNSCTPYSGGYSKYIQVYSSDYSSHTCIEVGSFKLWVSDHYLLIINADLQAPTSVLHLRSQGAGRAAGILTGFPVIPFTGWPSGHRTTTLFIVVSPKTHVGCLMCYWRFCGCIHTLI
jgi:hypothetical protein